MQSRPRALSVLLMLGSLMLSSLQVHSAEISVITSNRPLALLAQGILGEDGQAQSLLKPGQSPHDFALSFSDRQQLENTHLIIWIGESIEPYLDRILRSSHTHQLRLDQLFELQGKASAHHGDHDHHDHDHNAEDDFHLWLSPRHAMTISQAIAEQLGQQYPELKQRFAARQGQQQQQIANTDKAVQALLADLADSRYGIAHNAYSHFIEHYQLPQPQVVSQSTEQSPGIRRLLQLRKQLPQQSCLVVEPEHTNGWPQQLAQRESYRLVQVDTLAARQDYPSYSDWLMQLGQDFKRCLQ